MKTCPKIGDRVRWRESCVYGGGTGTVMAIYESYVYDDINDRPTFELEPESEWSVSVKVDKLPVPWCYPGRDRFAPQVKQLTPAK